MKKNVTKHHPKRLLGVFAHPDDESFCAGGTFASYVANGAEVMVVSSQAERQWMQRAVLAVNATFPEVQFAQWPTCERCLPHARICATWSEGNLTLTEAARLFNRVVAYLYARGQYLEAENFINLLSPSVNKCWNLIIFI